MQIMPMLEKLMKDRATKRLDRDIKLLENSIRNNSLFADTKSAPLIANVKPGFEKGEHPYYFFKTTSVYAQELREKTLPIYIQRELEMFVRDVESLVDQLDIIEDVDI